MGVSSVVMRSVFFFPLPVYTPPPSPGSGGWLSLSLSLGLAVGGVKSVIKGYNKKGIDKRVR